MAKKAPKSPLWTREQDKYLASVYYQRGSARATELLNERFGTNRTQAAVRVRARKVLNSVGVPDGWIGITDVEPIGDSKFPTTAIVLAATRDGVMRTVRAYTGRSRIVPQEWADAYLERRRKEAEDVEATKGWLTTEEVATLFGVSKTALKRSIMDGTKYTIGDFSRSITRRMVNDRGNLRHMWEPTSTERAVKRWKASGRKLRGAKGTRSRTPSSSWGSSRSP